MGVAGLVMIYLVDCVVRYGHDASASLHCSCEIRDKAEKKERPGVSCTPGKTKDFAPHVHELVPSKTRNQSVRPKTQDTAKQEPMPHDTYQR